MTSMELDNIIEKLEGYVATLRPTPTDDLATDPILEVQLLDRWFLVDPDTFRSWTGHRRRDGDVFHGDVFYMDSDRPYSGARACPCPTCQSSVEPRHKKN